MKDVNRNFPNYYKYKPAFTVVEPAERGDNRVARRRDIALARRMVKTPYFNSKEYLMRKFARIRLVAYKLKFTKRERRAMAEQNRLKERKRSLSFTKHR